MTTEVKRRFFGVQVGRPRILINNESDTFIINPFTDHRVDVGDRKRLEKTIIHEKWSTFTGMLERLLAFRQIYTAWESNGPDEVQNGKTTIVGPRWNSLEIHRRE